MGHTSLQLRNYGKQLSSQGEELQHLLGDVFYVNIAISTWKQVSLSWFTNTPAPAQFCTSSLAEFASAIQPPCEPAGLTILHNGDSPTSVCA